MKKIIVLLVIIAIIITSIILIKNKTTDTKFTVTMSTEKETVKVGEDVILTIKTNETIIASNFEINYDSELFKLEGSETNNFNVAEKNGKIACIYADITGTGTNEFKIKFTSQKANSSKSGFKIENAKFRAEGKTESYTGEQISGINKELKIKVDD